MPKAWSAKEERQYEHIKESSLDRGTDEDRAEEIAARTVNKQRRERGETRNKKSMGTGNPNKDLKDRTKQELLNLAKEKNIRGRSRMTKDELIKAIK